MSKIKTIKLEATRTIDNDNAAGWRPAWKVLQTTDSIEFNPGQLLGKTEVETLCDAKSWKVTIVPGPFG